MKNNNLHYLSTITNEMMLSIVNDKNLTPLARYILIDIINNGHGKYDVDIVSELLPNSSKSNINDAFTLLCTCGYLKRFINEHVIHYYIAPNGDFDTNVKYNFN